MEAAACVLAMFNEPQMIKQVIKNSIKEGFKHIDCAKLYSGIPEEQIGQAIKEALQMYNVKREEIYITSSLRDIPSHTIMLEKGENTVKQEYEELIGNQCTSSLKQLGVEYLDLLLVNYDADDEERFKNIWCAMENLVDQGLVKSIGVNNISVLEIHEMLSWARIRPVCPYPSNTL